MNDADEMVGYTSPSQLVNVPSVIMGIIGCIFFIYTETYIMALASLVLPVLRMIEFHYWRYEFGELTIQERKGVFSVTRKEMTYYRIKSVMVEEPFWMRLFNLGNVTLISSDPLMPNLQLYAIKNPNKTRDVLKQVVHVHRKETGTREFDTYSLNK